jgi:hypothetical protein
MYAPILRIEKDGGSMFLQNIDKHIADYTASHPR